MTVQELREALDQFAPYDRVTIVTDKGGFSEFEVAGPFAEGPRVVLDATMEED